jgi:hypothetical protein
VIAYAMSVRSTCVRALAAIVLVSIALVPSMARAHDRLDHQRTPAQQHSRFRWTNSCESVPQKHTTAVVVQPAEGPTHTIVDAPTRVICAAEAADITPPQSPSFRSPHGLRAPPSSRS